MKAKVVKIGSVALTVYPWRHPSGRDYWRWSWHDSDGNRKYGTRAKQADAIKAARSKAMEIHNGTLNLAELSKEQQRLVSEFLALAPTWEHLNALREIMSRSSISCADAVAEFLELKESSQGRSNRHLGTLRKNLAHLVNDLGSTQVDQITVSDLDAWLAERNHLAPRSRQNLRGTLITFWRWCKTRDYVPDKTTAAEKMAKPIAERKAPSTYTPEEMALILEHARPCYLPWLVLAGFAGIRNEEIHAPTGSRKSPLLWSDIDLERGIITVRPETSKTGTRRVIELQANLIAWLATCKAVGSVGHAIPPDRSQPGGPETKRLGEIIGGWKRNALRHSFVSYRAAQAGIARAALEAGNSESESKRSYHNAMSQAEGEAWFSIMPEEHRKNI